MRKNGQKNNIEKGHLITEHVENDDHLDDVMVCSNNVAEPDPAIDHVCSSIYDNDDDADDDIVVGKNRLALEHVVVNLEPEYLDDMMSLDKFNLTTWSMNLTPIT